MNLRNTTWLALALSLSGCGDEARVEDAGTSEACESFCDTGHVLCDLLSDTPNREACLAICENDLKVAAVIGATCATAQEAGFACAGGLDCVQFDDWIDSVPPDDYPCRAESLAIGAACEQQ